MTLEDIRAVLGWCSIMNGGILLFWFLMFLRARGFVYRVHSGFFKLSEERFDEIHYNLMGFFKLSVFLFNLVPYLALLIVTR